MQCLYKIDKYVKENSQVISLVRNLGFDMMDYHSQKEHKLFLTSPDLIKIALQITSYEKEFERFASYIIHSQEKLGLQLKNVVFVSKNIFNESSWPDLNEDTENFAAYVNAHYVNEPYHSGFDQRIIELIKNLISDHFEEELKQVSQEMLRVFRIESSTHAQRSIQFKPEHKYAGIQILAYFQETLNQKYPLENVTVRIAQTDNTVTMEIETLDGKTEKYEKAFEEYGLVVTGQKPVEEYLENKLHQAQLLSKLDLAAAEIRNLERLLDIERDKNQQLLDDKTYFQQSMKTTLEGVIQLGAHLGDALKKAIGNQDIPSILENLDKILHMSGQGKVECEINEIKSNSPSLWHAIKMHAYNIAEKTVYTGISDQLITLIDQIP